MRQALDIAASAISPGSSAMTISWSIVGYQQVAVIRSKLSGYAPSTANKTLAAVRGVLRQAFALGQIDPEVYQRATSVRSVRGARVVRGRAVTKAELKKLFEVCDVRTVAGARDAALLAVAYGAGLRRSEITQLDLSDLDPTTWKLIIRGKGNKQRLAYATNGARLALAKWTSVRGSHSGPLFLPVNKADRIEHRRMTEQAVYMILRRLGQKAKIEKFSPHDLRRTFIGDLLDAGADIVTVQALAAHASVTTTARYDRRPERTRQKAAEMIHVPFGGAKRFGRPSACVRSPTASRAPGSVTSRTPGRSAPGTQATEPCRRSPCRAIRSGSPR